MSGKGDARRPATVPRETMDANWSRTFDAAPLAPADRHPDREAWLACNCTAQAGRPCARCVDWFWHG